MWVRLIDLVDFVSLRQESEAIRLTKAESIVSTGLHALGLGGQISPLLPTACNLGLFFSERHNGLILLVKRIIGGHSDNYANF